MPQHDIIDNRNEKLLEHINRILSSTEMARFAVGYLFLSGLEGIGKKLSRLKELRLLIGNTVSQNTLEMLVEGYKRLELVSEVAEEETYLKRIESKRRAVETVTNLRESIELMDQTDETETLVKTLVRMIEEKRLKVRLYTKGRLHAKAYIFDYGKVFDDKGREVIRHENGIAIVGSSNLTLAGLTHNTELNVIVQGNDNHKELVRWFEELWKESQDFDEALMHEMQQSWAVAQVTPYDIYMKTLYTLVKERLEGGNEREILWDDDIKKKLADFQLVAVRQAVQMIQDYGGAFIADVVGLGKSYMGAAVVKYFERRDGVRPIIICPASLVEMWDRYNEVYHLNARILSMGMLREDKQRNSNLLLDDFRYKDRNFVLVDESHNFRYPDTQRYNILQPYLAIGRRCCFLTATPRNKSAWDIYHQIKLFHQDDKTDLPVSPPDLKEYFKLVENGDKRLPDLLANILIRRTRNHILRWYGYDAETHNKVDSSPSGFRPYQEGRKRAYIMVAGRHQFFPKRELETIEYSIEDTYQGLYQELRGYLGRARIEGLSEAPECALKYSRYGLWNYVKKEKQRAEPYASLHRAGANLRGLMRVLLFKRFESSVFAFRQTIERLLAVHERFGAALAEGIIPAGDEAQEILYEPNQAEEQDIVDALRQVAGRYNAEDFDIETLQHDIEHDVEILKKIRELIGPITPEKDAKLQTLKQRLSGPELSVGKCLIFTQYADTARYLFDNINPNGERDDIDVIYSGDKSKVRVVGRFAPKANPEYRFQKGETELNILVSTDVLAEGLNLQDCDKIINYDLHWNPVRLIQRFGRIDRIGSENEVIYAYNFLPETGIERNLGLREKLQRRIREIHETIGEDSQILDKSEQLNPEAMYAIYEKKGGQLSLFEEEEEEFIGLNEAEEMLRKLRQENPAEYDRIANLRDGIRSSMYSNSKGLYVFCSAGAYQQLFLLNDKGEVISRDIPRVLGTIKCGPQTKAAKMPKDYNASVMRVKRLFSEEVKHREAEREHTLSLTYGQRYVLRELRVLFGAIRDEDEKTNINILEKAFRAPVSVAVNRELNRIRRNGMTGDALLKELISIYHHHRMRDLLDNQDRAPKTRSIPKIICSEALVTQEEANS